MKISNKKTIILLIIISFIITPLYYTHADPPPNIYNPYSYKYRFAGKEQDKGTGLYKMGSRYYNPEIGRFISPDRAVRMIGDKNFEKISGVSLREFISNPQNLNSYSYARNNPILLTDPTGDSVYKANDGTTTTFDDSDTNTYYEQNDINMIQKNAEFMKNNQLDFKEFYKQVSEGKPWDFKNNPKDKQTHHFWNGSLVTDEVFGNLHYGFMGQLGGFGLSMILAGAGAAQIKANTSDISFVFSNFDDPRDQENIKKGFSQSVIDYGRNMKGTCLDFLYNTLIPKSAIIKQAGIITSGFLMKLKD